MKVAWGGALAALAAALLLLPHWAASGTVVAAALLALAVEPSAERRAALTADGFLPVLFASRA